MHRPIAVAAVALAAQLAAGLPATAQPLTIPEAVYPTLPAAAANAAGFVPAGWRQELQARGDLNEDGIDDMALLLRDQSPANVLDNKGLGPRRFDTNPRLLAVAFGQAGGGYRLVAEDHRLVRRPTYPTQEDPIEGAGDLAIRRGTLVVRMHLFSNAGSYGTAQPSFTLRWQGGRLELIGYDNVQVDRGSGAMETLSVNYSVGRASRITGRIDTDLTQTRHITLQQRPLLALREIGDGIDFDPGLPRR